MTDDMRRTMGGSAQPPSEHGWGMTLLDYFAGQALPAIIAANASTKLAQDDAVATVSRIAYQIAKAMIEERNRVIAQLHPLK